VDKASDRTDPTLISRTDLIPFTRSSGVPIVVMVEKTVPGFGNRLSASLGDVPA
jgi:hypothetical protein